MDMETIQFLRWDDESRPLLLLWPNEYSSCVMLPCQWLQQCNIILYMHNTVPLQQVCNYCRSFILSFKVDVIDFWCMLQRCMLHVFLFYCSCNSRFSPLSPFHWLQNTRPWVTIEWPFCVKFCFATACLELWSLAFEAWLLLNLHWMLSANFKPKRTAAASRGFLATARFLVSKTLGDDEDTSRQQTALQIKRL